MMRCPVELIVVKERQACRTRSQDRFLRLKAWRMQTVFRLPLCLVTGAVPA